MLRLQDEPGLVSSTKIRFFKALLHPYFLAGGDFIIILNRKRLKPKALSGIIWTVLILFGIVYIYRMFTPNGIVVFQPEKGLLYKIFNK